MTNLQGEDMCTPTFPDDDKNSTQSSFQQFSDSQQSQNQGVSKKNQKSGKEKQQKNQKEQKNTQKVSCHLCQKKYTNKYSLQTHLKTLHKTKPHECEVCPNVSFWELKQLKHHMEVQHLDYLIEQCRIQKEKEDAEKAKKDMEEQNQKQLQNVQNQKYSQQPQQQVQNQNQQYQNQGYHQQQQQLQGKNNSGYNTFDMIIEQEENSSSTQTSNGNNQNNINQQQQQQFLDFDNIYHPFNDSQQNYYSNSTDKYQQNQDSFFSNNQDQNKNQYVVPQNPVLYRTNSSQLTKEGMQNRILYLQNKMKHYMQNKNIDSLKKVQDEINYLIHCLKTKNYLPSKQQQQHQQVKQVNNSNSNNNNNLNFTQDLSNIDDYLKTSESPRNINQHNNFYSSSNSNNLLDNNDNINNNTDCFLGDSEFNDQLQFENFMYE